MDDSVDQLAASAAVLDFLPLLGVPPHARAFERDQARPRPGPRGRVGCCVRQPQRRRTWPDRRRADHAVSENRVSVHSAGTAVHGQIDPGVRAVIGELGVDPDEAFARPVTDEVLRCSRRDRDDGPQRRRDRASPRGVSHEDWRVGDPVGAPIDRGPPRARRHRAPRPDAAQRPRRTTTDREGAPRLAGVDRGRFVSLVHTRSFPSEVFRSLTGCRGPGSL